MDEIIAGSVVLVRAGRKKLQGPRGAALVVRSTSRAFERVLRLQARIDPAAPETIHRTRVAFKRFRYMAETLAEHLPAPDKVMLEAMHAYQTMMGDIQDADVLCEGFERYLHKRPMEPALAHEFAAELSRRRQRFIEIYLRQADELFDFWARPRRVRVGREGDPAPRIQHMKRRSGP